MNERNYNVQEVVAIGQDAHRVLNSPAFMLAYQNVNEDLMKRFFECEPGHTRTLEEIRREGNALAKVIQQLSRQVKIAETEIERANKAQDNQ